MQNFYDAVSERALILSKLILQRPIVIKFNLYDVPRQSQIATGDVRIAKDDDRLAKGAGDADFLQYIRRRSPVSFPGGCPVSGIATTEKLYLVPLGDNRNEQIAFPT